MKITEFERQLKSLQAKADLGTITVPFARSKLRELDVVRNNAETSSKRFVMTLFLQTYQKSIMQALRVLPVAEIEPLTIMTRK